MEERGSKKAINCSHDSIARAAKEIIVMKNTQALAHIKRVVVDTKNFHRAVNRHFWREGEE